MPLIDFVARTKLAGEMCGLAAGMSGPARKRFFEINIEHDPAEIEQQRVG